MTKMYGNVIGKFIKWGIMLCYKSTRFCHNEGDVGDQIIKIYKPGRFAIALPYTYYSLIFPPQN